MWLVITITTITNHIKVFPYLLIPMKDIIYYYLLIRYYIIWTLLFVVLKFLIMILWFMICVISNHKSHESHNHIKDFSFLLIYKLYIIYYYLLIRYYIIWDFISLYWNSLLWFCDLWFVWLLDSNIEYWTFLFWSFFLLSELYSVRLMVNLLSRYNQNVTFTFIFL